MRGGGLRVVCPCLLFPWVRRERMQGSTNLDTRRGKYVRLVAQAHQSTVCTPDFWVQDVPRNLRPGVYIPSVPLIVRLPAPTPILALNVHHPALPADPVGGEVLPLAAETASQTPAQMVGKTGYGGERVTPGDLSPRSPHPVRPRKWTLDQDLGAPLPFL